MAADGPRPVGFDVHPNLSEGPNLNFAGPGRPAGILSLLAPKKVSKEMAWLSPDFYRESCCIQLPVLCH